MTRTNVRGRPTRAAALARVERWFSAQEWAPFPFQRALWAADAAGESGLLLTATGTGKTYAAALAPMLASLSEEPSKGTAALTLLWITPLRALAADLASAIERAARELELPWTVEVRSGDTSTRVRARQRVRLPTVLITTPESLSLLLTYPDARERFSALRSVVVDEWHELMGSKRGTQTELALARLRRWTPALRTWGLSATIGNPDEALRALLGPGRRGRLLHGAERKRVTVRSLMPPRVERFPWAGHLGLHLLEPALVEIERSKTALVFTNTRSQAELWYQAIAKARPEWPLGLHHGSIDRKQRDAAEEGLRNGTMRCVVATSSLDLGVDFAPVDLVIQIGSPKGSSRLVQRAGRSGHRPGEASEVICVPAHSFELIESAAARAAIDEGLMESRALLRRPLDVLVQHLVTAAAGGGFTEDELRAEVSTTEAFHDLSDAEWRWALSFVTTGGVLHGYPEYRRVSKNGTRYEVDDRAVAARHRLSVGTITSDGAVEVRLMRGRRLGTVEESFVSKLRPGDKFVFAGRKLAFVRLMDMRLHVKAATGGTTAVPRWLGGKLPMSDELGQGVRRLLGEAREGRYVGPEMAAVRPILELQARLSRLPGAGELLVEFVRSREGRHVFIFPFAGRLVHEGLAALAALRLSRGRPATFTMTANDYGFELLTRGPVDIGEDDVRKALSMDALADDIQSCLNASEMARRQFREIARVAGLVFQGTPWRPKTARQVQASSGLIYDVFRRHDPGNPLLAQADREVLERQLEVNRLTAALRLISAAPLAVTRPERISPLGFPLFAERAQAEVTSEAWSARVQRMALALEQAAERT